ncbi:thiaminase II [Saccharibacillus sacchari]|uniref:Thiaminase II n=1 Tax=Saccharibacillus sacchari TaxID=456493 RepID=A0ACC6PG91_9BACL
MQKTIQRAMPFWEACVETPFIQEMKSGRLPMDKFKHYIIQDSIFLKHYARVCGKAMYHASSFRDIQFLYSILRFVEENESSIRVIYLKKLGLNDEEINVLQPAHANRNSIRFLLNMAEQGDTDRILMALLPCLLSYSHIFRTIAAAKEIEQSDYKDFIIDYADEGYAQDCLSWIAFVDERFSDWPEDKQNELATIFEEASSLEVDFWHMAYQG